MSEQKTETTSVSQVDVNLDDILGTGVDTVMLAEESTKKKKSLFSPMTPDTTFLDKVDDTTTEKKTETKESKDSTDEAKEEIEEEKEEEKEESKFDPLAQPDIVDEEEEKNKGGRPTTLVAATKNLLKKGVLTPFKDDDGKDEAIDNYTAEDFQELIEANFENYQQKMSKELPSQFLETLPPEMKEAYTYISNGGTDLKGMFGALAASTEMRDVDITQEAGQKYAIRAYLQSTQWGTPEEIEDEIYSLEDKGNLEKKAKQFKPKLDAMQQNIVNQKMAEQEGQAKQRSDQSQKYIESVYSTLEKGDLNGLKLDNKMQNMLYSGLVQSNYPSVGGKQTNMLGHLLEKYQWVEPNHGLIAEALWLLADPEGYRKTIGSDAETETTKKTLRTLKTEQATKSGSSVQEEKEGTSPKKRSGLQRPKRNFFGR